LDRWLKRIWLVNGVMFFIMMVVAALVAVASSVATEKRDRAKASGHTESGLVPHITRAITYGSEAMLREPISLEVATSSDSSGATIRYEISVRRKDTGVVRSRCGLVLVSGSRGSAQVQVSAKGDSIKNVYTFTVDSSYVTRSYAHVEVVSPENGSAGKSYTVPLRECLGQ
jgi:hypothetical protein